MKNFLVLLFSLTFWFSTALADSTTTGGARVLENPTSNGNLLLRVNVGGTKADVLTFAGATGEATVGPSAVGTNLTHTFQASNGINLRAFTSGTNGVSLELRRDGGTTARWQTYLPTGSSSYTFWNTTGGDVGNITTAGAWNIGADSATTSGILNIRKGPGQRPELNWYKNGTARFTIGVASGASDLITGISSDDVALRVNNTNFHVSTNDGTSSSFTVGAGGGTTFGATGFSGIHTFNGFPRFDETLGWSFGSQRPGLYYTLSGTSTACSAQCDTDRSSHGFGGSSSGLCIAAWTSANAASLCATAATGQKCLCAAID